MILHQGLAPDINNAGKVNNISFKIMYVYVILKNN